MYFGRTRVCMHVCTCTGVCSCEFMCLVACHSDADSFVQSTGNRRPGPDPDLCSQSVDTLGDSKTDYEMIWRFVPIRAVKTRRWFGSKIAFHFKWVFAFVLFSYLSLSIAISVLLVSFHVTIWYIIPAWLCVSLHETSLSAHLIYLVDMSDYLRYFMCSCLPLLIQD